MALAAVKFSALDLCYQGQYLAAGEALSLRPGEWPENVSEGNSAHAERLLVAGIITSTLAGIQQSGDQDAPKAMLIESARLSDDPSEAESWLARAHHWAGEYDQALSLSDSVLARNISPRLRFWTLLLKVIVFRRQGLQDNALTCLKEMEPLYDEQGVLLKGKFHLQRANVFESDHETDRAIAEFDYASEFFNLAGDVRCQAIAINNLASLYRDTGRYGDAHTHASRARVLFEQLGDKTYQAKALDQSASIYLAEGKFEQAERSIVRAIELLSNDNPTLTECLATHDKIKNIVATEPKDARVKLTATPTRHALPGPHVPERRNEAMTPINCASRILRNPENAPDLYALLIFASGANGDVQHEAEMDHVQAVVYAMTPDGEKHREAYRKLCLDQPVISDS